MIFKQNYFLAAVFLFILEVLIAVFVRDSFIRPYAGDLLVVVFLYSLLKSFFRIPVKNVIFGVLLFSFLIEALQYVKLINILQLQDNSLASAVLGSHFDWLDILLYVLGGLTIFAVEKLRNSPFRSNKKSSA